MDTAKALRLTEKIFKEELQLGVHVKSGKSLNPLAIIPISKVFPQLKINDEDPLLLHYKDVKDSSSCNFLISSKHIFLNNERISIKNFQQLNEEQKKSKLQVIGDLSSKAIELINGLTTSKSTEQLTKSDFDRLIGKFKKIVDIQSSENQNFELEVDYLDILKIEGDKCLAMCQELDQDKNFVNSLNAILGNDAAEDYKAAHVFLYDIIKMYKKITASYENTAAVPLKGKFILAYLFEKLQNKDLIDALSIERINQMATGEKFDANIDKIAHAQFFDLGEKYKNEFLLPSLLLRIEHLDLENASSTLYRIASLIAKSDGKIDEDERKILKNILAKISKPKKELAGVKQTEVADNDSLEKVLAELDELIGLTNIKKGVKELINFLEIQKLREKEGLKTGSNSLHTVFMGPPGTGKTTIARLMGRIYKHLGYLEQGHLVETDRAGLVAGYVGQTAMKVDKVVQSAIGGILFIDEAYSLSSGNERDFGKEAIEALLKRMEDHRKEMIVIVAGYSEEMKEFVRSNPGLQSRFSRFKNFEHFSPDQLVKIFMLFANKADFIVSEDASAKLLDIFDRLYEKRHKSFGNARVVRNLFEKIIERQANRIIAVTPITRKVLQLITEEDVPPILKTVEEFTRFIENQEE